MLMFAANTPESTSVSVNVTVLVVPLGRVISTDSGVFAANINILPDFTFGFNRTHRTFVLTYTDVDEGVTVQQSVDVAFSTAQVSVSPSEVAFGGGTITVTIVDNDLNIDPDVLEIRRFGL
jgi:hypothetical protein